MPLADAATYPLWINAAVFAVGAALVWVAGAKLTGYLAAIAKITDIEEAFAGMFLLGLITSLPEVANVLTSSHFGHPALAVNNLLGSASINVVMLAFADAVAGGGSFTSRVARPSALLQCALAMLALTLVAAAVATGDRVLPRTGLGLWPITLFIASAGAFRLSYRYGRREPWKPADEPAQPVQRPRPLEYERGAGRSRLGLLAARTAVAGAVLFTAGYVLAQTGDALAAQTGLGTGLVGFLLIGFSTSLPELSSIVEAFRLGRYEMALGEVLGTNFVNLSLILLADIAFAGGPVIDELGRFEILSSLLGVLLTGVYMVGLLERRRAFLHVGYDSLAVMLLFAAGILLLFAAQ